MSMCAKIYQIKRKMKVENRSLEGIKAICHEKTIPKLNNFKQWCDKKQPLVPQKLPMVKAMNHTLRYWSGLVRICVSVCR